MVRTAAKINPYFRVLLGLALAASLLLVPAAHAQTLNPFTKEVSPDPAIVGEQITFTLTTTNTEFFRIQEGIGDNLPRGVEFVSATVVTPDAPQGTPCDYREDVHYVVCGLFILDRGESATATVVVVAQQPGDFINQGQSSFGGVVRVPFTVIQPAEEPEPTTKEQCKNGGYSAFGFRNQGDCVSFVATEGKNEPGKNQKTK